MNTFEFYRQLEKITVDVIREIGVQSVRQNQNLVLSQLADANDKGLTFDGNKIAGHGYFTDWIDTGLFRENLRFIDDTDIELISYGEGADAIHDAFDEVDYIAPTSKVLDQTTKNDIKKSFIQILKAKL